MIKRKQIICENLVCEAKEKLGKAAKQKIKIILESSDDQSEEIHKAANKRMETICEMKKERRDEAFDEVKNYSMIDPSILKSWACEIIQREKLSGTRKGLTLFAIFITNLSTKRQS